MECFQKRPNVSIAQGGAQFMDLAGDGKLDLVMMEGATPGFYELDENEEWTSFQPFLKKPNLSTRDPNIKFIDLNGDGHADILMTEDQVLTWYPSLAENGFGPAQQVAKPMDEESGPALVFADSLQSIYLADLSGDGLTDIVRIRNGQICYWPNLGYGRFGAKVTMDYSPWFDSPDLFDQRRIRLADIDGSGTTDIFYLHPDGVRIYFNRSGNAWSEAHVLPPFPSISDLTHVNVVDLFGNGTACLVWSTALPSKVGQQIQYIDLMGGKKPHLLENVKNNLGAETNVYYASSTKFYIRDKLEGKPWITKLPFPVHVVEQVETYDHISRNRFVSRYAYHHGYFDGEEREFRGFGMVEQWDTEEIGSVPTNHESSSATNLNAASYVPPVHTKTWFHTGVYLDRDRISHQFEAEYFREPDRTDEILPDTILPPELTSDEEREACRALKGTMLRQEIYALDGTGTEAYPSGYPYTVTEQNLTIKLVQLKGDNRHAVFFTHPRETISYHYERNPIDPRIQHALTLETDKYGNVLRAVAIGYPRKDVADRQPEQNETHITLTLNRVANCDDEVDWYRLGLPVETHTFELVKPPATDRLLTWDELRALVTALAPLDQHEPPLDNTIPYGQWDWRKSWNPALEPGGLIDGTIKYSRLRLIEHVRTLYRPNDLGASENNPLALLPLGEVQSLALPGESYQLSFTSDLLAQVFKRPRAGQLPEPLLPDPVEVLTGQAGYLQSQALKANGRFPNSDSDHHWWLPSGRVFYSPKATDSPQQELAFARTRVFLPHRYCDPLGQNSFVFYDSDDTNPQKNHNLFIVKTEDAVGNSIEIVNNYRVLKPVSITDPNGNRSEVRFDALGLVVGTAVMGKGNGTVEGDSFEDFETDLTPQQINDYFEENNPRSLALAHLGTATTRIVYDLNRVPACAATIVRETHVSDLNGQLTKLQLIFSYSDGFGREIQKKIQAEPGPVPKRGPDGKIIVVNGHPQMTEESVDPRWVGSGWTIFNNKGKPVRQYEPFFSDTNKLDNDIHIGVSPWLFYDPVGRIVATLHPNHTWEKVVFNPWQQTTYDMNDTILNPDGSADPKKHPDVAGFFEHLPGQDYLPTWYELRTVPEHAIKFALLYPNEEDRKNETKAAQKAAAHANTPTTAHLDTLGRPFLTIEHNKVICAGHKLDETEDKFHTRVELDIEGNQRTVTDAKDRVVMHYDYDLLGNRIHQSSMEAGERWILNNVAGNPIRAWNSRGHTFRTEYDQLHRPLRSFVIGSDPDDPNQEWLTERFVYGEQHPQAEQRNLRGKLHLHFDQAGVAISESYDFKGNLLQASRRIAKEYKNTINWHPVDDDHTALPLDAKAKLNLAELETALASWVNDTYISSTRYDSLNRPIQLVAPHSNQPGTQVNIIQPSYNEVNLLEKVDAWINQVAEPDNLLNPTSANLHAVKNIDYDAKGQRTLIEYGSGAIQDQQGVTTTYTYDPLTFRLTHLFTQRNAATFPGDCPQQPPADWPGCQVQNLHYTYDPVGNIIHIRDEAQQTIYFKNHRVDPSSDYTYDALYRLIEATGREHLGQTAGMPNAPSPHSYNDSGRVGVPSTDGAGRFAPNDGKAMGTYTEQYVYDAVGNFLAMQHCGSNPTHSGWTRSYAYNEESLIEPGKQSNRLSSTTVGNANPEEYAYDLHGNMLSMPQLQKMEWDYKDQLRMTQRQKVNDEDVEGSERHGERTWYVYDAAGQRVRKITELANNGGLKDERIYLGGFEIYRQHTGNHAGLVRETLHIMDDKQRVALVETRNDVNDGTVKQLIRYQFSNHLGSAGLELDDKAAIISYEEYTPYGSTSYQAVRNQTETPKRYRYTGKERDEESGFNYHGARYYAPWLGRWTSCDPIDLQGEINLYTYGAQSPIDIVDPLGTAPKKYEDQRRRDTAAKAREMRKNLEESKGIPDPMQKRADNLAKKRGKTPIEQHHHKGVQQAAEGGLDPKKMGDPMSSVWSTKRDPTVQAGIGDRPVWDPKFNGKKPTHHNVAKMLDMDEQAKVPKTGEGLEAAAEASKQRLPATADLTERAKMDWTPTHDKGPPVDPHTGKVLSKEAKVLKAGEELGEKTLEKSSKAVKVATKLGKAGRHFAAALPIAGIVLGQASAAHAATQGDYTGAVLDEVGFVPILGDVLDAARGGIAVGEALDEGLGISDVAAEHGERFEKAAKFIGLGKDASIIVGATGAALSSITIAPAIALQRTVIGWFR